MYVSTSVNGEYKPPIEASSSSERALFEGKEDKKSESITDSRGSWQQIVK